jgi:diguanylate cyclase (GGDEF)-like protein/PAS domain S-box-containing protein
VTHVPDVAPMVSTKTVRHMLRVFQQVQAHQSFDEVLQGAADAIVDIVGFDIVALNIRRDDGNFEVRAVSGSEEAREVVLGHIVSAVELDDFLKRAIEWGTLRYLPYDRQLATGGTIESGYVPDLPPPDASQPDAWHPEDMLSAMIYSPNGDIVGFISVDLPRDRRRPGPFQRELLSVVAGQVGIAVHQARLNDRLRSSEQAFRLAFDNAGNGICIVSLRDRDAGRFVRVNPAMADIVGLSTQQLLAGNIADLRHPGDQPLDLEALREVLLEGGPYRFERRYLHPTRSTRWLAYTTTLGYDNEGNPELAICQIEDISDQRVHRARLAHLAKHDDLTGLPNRRALADEIAAAAEDAVLHDMPGVLVFCDLDGFKSVNDIFGHKVGDRVLQIIAQRMSRAIRAEDTIIRYGGDEFVVVAPSTSPDDGSVLEDRLRGSIGQPIQVDDHAISVSASFGSAAITANSRDVDDLIRRADFAMYQAKPTAEVPRQAIPR